MGTVTRVLSDGVPSLTSVDGTCQHSSFGGRVTLCTRGRSNAFINLVLRNSQWLRFFLARLRPTRASSADSSKVPGSVRGRPGGNALAQLLIWGKLFRITVCFSPGWALPALSFLGFLSGALCGPCFSRAFDCPLSCGIGNRGGGNSCERKPCVCVAGQSYTRVK